MAEPKECLANWIKSQKWAIPGRLQRPIGCTSHPQEGMCKP